MNTWGWIVFVWAVAEAGIRLAYLADEREYVIKPTLLGCMLSVGMCVVVWLAVNS